MHKHTALITCGVVAGSVLVAAPAPAASPTDRVTTFLFDADSGKGLVALAQGTSGAELSFHLYGLRGNARYKLVVSRRGCASTKGTIASRAFRTDARGFAWDPVAVPSTATPVSARIVRAATGKVVVCNKQPQSAPPPTDVLKLTNASPGLLTVSRNVTNWRVSMSIGGLKSRKTYQIFAFDGGCETSSPVVATSFFTSGRNGAALVELTPSLDFNQSIRAVGVIERVNTQVVFCKVL